jgi:hypothetical protein
MPYGGGREGTTKPRCWREPIMITIVKLPAKGTRKLFALRLSSLWSLHLGSCLVSSLGYFVRRVKPALFVRSKSTRNHPVTRPESFQ